MHGSTATRGRQASRARLGTIVGAGIVALALLAAGCSSSDEEEPDEPEPAPRTTIQVREPTTTVPVEEPVTADPGDLVYREGNELYVDGEPVGVETGGPARWRPGHPDELAYVWHSSPRRSGVFLFERLYLYNIETGEERLILDIDDYGWAEAGHNDFDESGDRVVFAAHEKGGNFQPYVLDIESGEVSRVETDTQVIDTVFAPDGRIMAVDTTRADLQHEPIVWVGEDGSLEPLPSSAGVNRDPVVSPDGRMVANIRPDGLLARLFVGRWQLVVTDLESGDEWIVGGAKDSFGPPRWLDERTVVVRHSKLNSIGIMAGDSRPAEVDVINGTITRLDDLPADAWDPDPLPG